MMRLIVERIERGIERVPKYSAAWFDLKSDLREAEERERAALALGEDGEKDREGRECLHAEQGVAMVLPVKEEAIRGRYDNNDDRSATTKTKAQVESSALKSCSRTPSDQSVKSVKSSSRRSRSSRRSSRHRNSLAEKNEKDVALLAERDRLASLLVDGNASSPTKFSQEWFDVRTQLVVADGKLQRAERRRRRSDLQEEARKIERRRRKAGRREGEGGMKREEAGWREEGRVALVRLQSWSRAMIASNEFGRYRKATIYIQSWIRMQKRLMEFDRTRAASIRLQSWMRTMIASNEFETCRTCAVQIQSWIRMRKCLIEFDRTRVASVRLQSWIRATIASCEFERHRTALICVQSWIRMQKRSIEFDRIRVASIKLQSWIRCMIASREFERHRTAAIYVQSWVRMQKRSIEFDWTRATSIKLQSWIRSKIASCAFETCRTAATQIQSKIRMRKRLVEFRRRRTVAICIQSWIRMQKCLIYFDRSRSASLKLQSWIRTIIIRDIERRCAAATRIQSYVRIQTRLIEFDRARSASIMLQSTVRAMIASREFGRCRTATVCIQSWIRMQKQQQQFDRTRVASISLQRWIRLTIAAQKFEKRWMAAKQIQSYVRIQTRLIEFDKARSASIMLQSRTRAMIASRDLDRLRTATICIQSWARLQRCRAALVPSKRAIATLVAFQNLCRGYLARRTLRARRASVLLIQAAWRGWRLGTEGFCLRSTQRAEYVRMGSQRLKDRLGALPKWGVEWFNVTMDLKAMIEELCMLEDEELRRSNNIVVASGSVDESKGNLEGSPATDILDEASNVIESRETNQQHTVIGVGSSCGTDDWNHTIPSRDQSFNSHLEVCNVCDQEFISTNGSYNCEECRNNKCDATREENLATELIHIPLLLKVSSLALINDPLWLEGKKKLGSPKNKVGNYDNMTTPEEDAMKKKSVKCMHLSRKMSRLPKYSPQWFSAKVKLGWVREELMEPSFNETKENEESIDEKPKDDASINMEREDCVRCHRIIDFGDIDGIYLCCGKRVCSSCHEEAQSKNDGLCQFCASKHLALDTIEQKLSLYRPYAEDGKAWAQYVMAAILDDVDATESATLLHVSAEQGHAPAMQMLASAYASGRNSSIPKSMVEARRWYSAAAKKGLILSQLNLGLMSLYGLGGEREMSEGIRWVTLATARGDANSQKLSSLPSSLVPFGSMPMRVA